MNESSRTKVVEWLQRLPDAVDSGSIPASGQTEDFRKLIFTTSLLDVYHGDFVEKNGRVSSLCCVFGKGT